MNYFIANKTSAALQKAPTIKEAVSYLAKLGGFLGHKGEGAKKGLSAYWTFSRKYPI